MGCLYCGKELPSIRFRDDEFCCEAHRCEYDNRLRKLVGRLGTPEPPPAGVAGFFADLSAMEGERAPRRHVAGLLHSDIPVSNSAGIGLAITPVRVECFSTAVLSAAATDIPAARSNPDDPVYMNDGCALPALPGIAPVAEHSPSVLPSPVALETMPEHSSGTPAADLCPTLPIETFYRNSPASGSGKARWQFTPLPVELPPFLIHTEPHCFEQQPAPAAPTSRRNVARMPERPRRGAGLVAIGLSYGWKGVAAALLLGGVLWLSGSRVVPAEAASDSKIPRQSLREAVVSRATVQLNPDFRAGANCWQGGRNWNKTWSHQPDGSVRVGQLAIYRPSVDLANYRFEFLAQVEQKSVGWVVRARDTRNYYAVKFNVTHPGPRPMVSVVRYPVVDGKKGDLTEVAPMVSLQNGVPYRIAVSVHGNTFTTWVEGQEVDSWTDDSLRTGGVGFFSDAGERARLFWAKVSNNEDFIGKFCAFFFGRKNDTYMDEGHPVYCGDPDSKRRLVSWNGFAGNDSTRPL